MKKGLGSSFSHKGVRSNPKNVYEHWIYVRNEIMGMYLWCPFMAAPQWGLSRLLQIPSIDRYLKQTIATIGAQPPIHRKTWTITNAPTLTSAPHTWVSWGRVGSTVPPGTWLCRSVADRWQWRPWTAHTALPETCNNQMGFNIFVFWVFQVKLLYFANGIIVCQDRKYNLQLVWLPISRW